ncbi:hypothetical protein AnigIFM63604_008866 [Aspergillus niger]|uniref:Uncharacterized protein n=1 Tax=Aspergillus niger TaxID=5061 RepID=A0A9W5ZV91_ASPNG|nr:hypothetical protein AnigIFM63604_008866 [Aspergillus niger]
MIDPLSVTGLAYPIAKDLMGLALKLRQASHEIRHARASLKKMSDQTETVAGAYELFRETMAGAKKVKGMGRTFEKHGKLIQKVKSKSRRLACRIQAITDMFSPLLETDHIDSVQRWIAQFRWYRKEKNVIAPLLMEMRILEGSMSLIATLVVIKMLQHRDHRTNSDWNSIQVQIKHLRRSMDIGFKKLQDDQRVQSEMLNHGLATVTVNHHLSPNDFAQEVLRMLKKEIPRTRLPPRQPPDSPLTPDSDPSSGSSAPHQKPPSTPPSSPPHSNAAGRGPMIPLEPKELSRQGLKEPDRTSQRQNPHPVNSTAPPTPPTFPSRANRIQTSSYQPLPTSPSPPPALPEFTSIAGDESEQEETPKEDRPQPGPYVPTALFGPPEPGPRPRPRAGQSSPTHLASSSSGSNQQAESRKMPYSNRHSGQQSGKLYSASKRRAGSQISIYGIDGEVTHTHLTGAIGLQPGWQRRKGESSR